jgi:predicted aspartyl protease
MLIHLHNYDTDYYPAMPVIEIRVRRRAGQQPLTLKAIVDSGADATMLPLSLMQQLRVRKSGAGLLSSTTNSSYEVDLYTVAVQIGDARPIYVEAIGSTQRNEVIVGRDVLNQFVTTLNAPANVVEIAE